MASSSTFSLIVILFQVYFISLLFTSISSLKTPKHYVVYMGSPVEAELHNGEASYLQMLDTFLPREETERRKGVHHYKHAFRGFSAMLTEEEAAAFSAFCKVPDFDMAQEVFETAVSICGQKEGLYSLMFNELLAAGQLLKATELLEAVLDRGFELGTFLYKNLVESLCKKDEIEVASGILHKMIDKGYGFDPAAFMRVIDGLGKMGNKKEANDFAEKMMEMASVGEVPNKVDPNARHLHQNNWQNILHRDDGSGIALKSLTRVKKGWGQGDLSSFQPQKVDYLDYWEDDE